MRVSWFKATITLSDCVSSLCTAEDENLELLLFFFYKLTVHITMMADILSNDLHNDN